MKVIRILLFVTLAITSFMACNPLKSSVLYGSRRIRDFEEQNCDNFRWGKHHVVRLYFDREGFLYPPEVSVSDKFLKANNYTFSPSERTINSNRKVSNMVNNGMMGEGDLAFYKQLYQKIITDHSNGGDDQNDGLKIPTHESERFKEQFDSASIARYAIKLNETIQDNGYNNVSFLMVGFNNHMIAENDSSFENTSISKLQIQQDNIEILLECYNQDEADSLNLKKTLFIEVHWDGKFTKRRGLKTALNYKPALRTSYKVGLTLRKFVDKLNPSVIKVNMLSHSSGANVICETMFNQISKVGRTREDQLWEYLTNKYQKQAIRYPTPYNRDVVVGLLAPSMPGIDTYNDYYRRSFHFEEDRYRTVIGYNVNDQVLRKQFGRGPIGAFINFLNSRDQLVKKNAFGSTALGCLEPEVERLKARFRKSYELEKLDFVNLSFNKMSNGSRKPNTIHEIESYFNNDQYKEFISAVYDLKR